MGLRVLKTASGDPKENNGDGELDQANRAWISEELQYSSLTWFKVRKISRTWEIRADCNIGVEIFELKRS